jgi:hypothetical protein
MRSTSSCCEHALRARAGSPPAVDAASVAALARALIDLLDRTARAFDDLAAVAPDAVGRELAQHGREVRDLRIRFAGPSRG